MLGLIFTLASFGFCRSVITSADPSFSVEYLVPNEIKAVKSVDSGQSVSIFCTSGQKISITNTFMSSYLVFIDSPKEMEVFVDSNETKIIEHFKQIRWTQPVIQWFDSSVVTSLMIRSFSRQCIGIVSHQSFRLQLLVKTIDLYRLSYFIIGLLLFFFGPTISRSSLFYYISCTTIGTFASFLIIFLIIGRYFPRKISGVVILLGSSAIVCAIQIFYRSVQTFLIEYSFYVFIYSLISSFISFALSYRFGPITNGRTLDLLQWLLQMIGLSLIVLSSQILHYSVFAILAIIVSKTLPIRQITRFRFNKRHKIGLKLLTESEFEQQSDVQTKKCLEELKAYCVSSECNAWNIICKLKDPIRFARFINGENHVLDEEIITYENSDQKHSFNDNNEQNDESISDEEIERLFGPLLESQ